MNKNNYWFIGLLFAFLLGASSCSESEGVDEYANWQEKNEDFLKDIADEAAANTDGTWKKIERWTKPGDTGETVVTPEISQFIYVKVLNEGEGTYSPLYTDSVDVHFRGKYRGLDDKDVIFYQSFYDLDDPDPEFAVSQRFRVANALYSTTTSGTSTVYFRYNCVGVTTALLHMKPGDRWLIHIPWQLGYGDEANMGIRGYTTLIYDLTLVDIIPQ